MSNSITNFFDLNQESMRDFFIRMGEKPFRAVQVMKWIYYQGITDLEKMTDLSRALRQDLSQKTCFTTPDIVSERSSADGTRKWLMGVDKHNCVESVFIPETDRGTLCVSSQIGCPLACSFCATGKQGFNRNLGVAEIIGQVWQANRKLGYFEARNRVITNVVMMGMGEPLLNFDNVIAAIDLMKDDLGFGLSHKRVTLSTAGVVPGIYRLADSSRVSLAISLHAPEDELRDILVPVNRHYPITDLITACRHYAAVNSGDSITFEYVMLKDVNDGTAEARHLARLLRGLPAKVNLIPFNPFPHSDYIRSPQHTIDRFRDILIHAGIMTITRKTRGEDIDAACGQLAGRVVPRAARLQKQMMETRS